MNNTHEETAAILVGKLRHSPEILEAIRLLLNTEAGEKTPSINRRKTANAGTMTQRDAELSAKVHAGTPRADVALEYGLSLQRVHQIMRMNPNPNPEPVKANKNAARDAEIVKQVAAKIPRTEIAIQYGISLERVHQIARGVAAPSKRKLTFEERAAKSHAKYVSFEPLTFGDEVNILVTKYEPLARKIAQDHLDGLNQAQLEAKYPADITDGDIAWWGAHYSAAYRHFIDHATGQWIR
jgi:hypothetical protein